MVKSSQMGPKFRKAAGRTNKKVAGSVGLDRPDGDRRIHRIGGGTVDNLRLKPKEATLENPGISVLKVSSPGEASRQIREAFPRAKDLHQAAKIVGSTTE